MADDKAVVFDAKHVLVGGRNSDEILVMYVYGPRIEPSGVKKVRIGGAETIPVAA